MLAAAAVRLQTLGSSIICTRAHSLSDAQVFEIPWTVGCQAPLSIGFPRQESWSALPFPPQGD